MQVFGRYVATEAQLLALALAPQSSSAAVLLKALAVKRAEVSRRRNPPRINTERIEDDLRFVMGAEEMADFPSVVIACARAEWVARGGTLADEDDREAEAGGGS